MGELIDEDLQRRVEALLDPGDIALNGAVVHTDLGGDEEVAMHDATLEVGERIAAIAGVEEWYVYSGNDDSEFASNQHQGRALEDDAFVWECQQLLREGTFDLVFYYRAEHDQDAIIEAIREAGYRVTGVSG
ncbi:MAG: DUF5778 family protein [Halobacteriales archaeon]